MASDGQSARSIAALERRPETSRRQLLSAVLAGLFAGIGAGLIFHATDRIPSIATLAGGDGYLIGWLVLLAGAIVGAVVFVRLVHRLTNGWVVPLLDRVVAAPLLTAAAGLGYGLVLWVVTVPVLVPVWLEFVAGTSRPIPYVHELGLAVTIVFGLLLGLCYPLIYSFVDRYSTSPSNDFG